jgi:hypothetical protein
MQNQAEAGRWFYPLFRKTLLEADVSERLRVEAAV